MGVNKAAYLEDIRAKQAYELIRTSGYPSIGEAIHLIYEYLHVRTRPVIVVSFLCIIFSDVLMFLLSLF